MGKKKRDVGRFVDPFEVEWPGVFEVEGPIEPEHVATPSSAASLARLAGALGFEVFERRGVYHDDSVTISARDLDRGIAFWATWTKSRAAGAMIYERGAAEWAEVPAPAEKLSGRGKDRGIHPTGYTDGVRLVATRSPLGVSIGVTELSSRLRALE